MRFPPLLPAAVLLLAVGLIAGCSGPGGTRATAVRERTASPACAPWPAGSSGPVLLVTAASNGQTYCVRTGQEVRVLLSGPSALPGGSQPPRLTGDALAAAPAHLLRPSSVTYTAVRPGPAVLIIAGLPCHALQPARDAAAPARPGAPAGSAAAAETAYRAWSAPATGTVRAAAAGGTPAGAECGVQRPLRVSILVR